MTADLIFHLYSYRISSWTFFASLEGAGPTRMRVLIQSSVVGQLFPQAFDEGADSVPRAQELR